MRRRGPSRTAGPADWLDDLLRWSWHLRRKPLESFMLVRAAAEREGTGLLVGHDGSLASCIDVGGARSATGEEELDRFVETVERRLGTALLERGHALHVVFERAPEEGRRLLEEAAGRQRRSSARLGLDLEGPIAERVERLAPRAAGERLTIACWSGTAVLPRDQQKREEKAVDARKEDWAPGEDESQCPFAADGALGARHLAFVESVQAVLEETGLAARVLGAQDAVRALRWWLMGPESVCDWVPATSANEAPPRQMEPAVLGAFPPPLAPQVLVEEPEALDARAVRLGSRLWAPFDMELGPRLVRPFSELMARLAAAGNLPLRVSVLIEGGGLRHAGAMMRHAAAPFLAFSSSDSLSVRDASRALGAHADAGRAVVRVRVQFLTWVDGAVATDTKREELARRASRLQQLVEGWGEIGVTRVTGDPLQALAMSAPGFACGSTAVAGLAPLERVLRMLPVSRPAPLARADRTAAASHMFLAPDGKALPFGFEGAEHGFDLIHGIPGRGKSVLLNTLGLAFCLQGGQARLPLQAVVDIGPSAAGLVEMVRDAPAGGQAPRGGALALAHGRLERGQPDGHAARLPLPAAGGAGLPGEPPVADGDAGRSGGPARRHARADRGDGAGRLRARLGHGRERRAEALQQGRGPGRGRGARPARDRAGSGGAAMGTPSTRCSRPARSRPRSRAQRRAVPTFSELPSAAQAEAVQGLVRGARYGSGGETVTERVPAHPDGTQLLLAEHVPGHVLRYRQCAPRGDRPGGGRADGQPGGGPADGGVLHAGPPCADADLVAREGGPCRGAGAATGTGTPGATGRSGRPRSASATTSTTERPARPPSAPRWSATCARRARPAPGSRSPASGWRISATAWSTWRPSTGSWARGGQAREVDAMAGVFGLSDTLAGIVKFDLTGPGAGGAPALLIAPGERGRLEQLVVNAPGPQELWALNTRPVDVALRRRVQSRLGPAEARKVLAAAFPAGSAEAQVEHVLAELEARGARSRASVREVLDAIADRLAGKEQRWGAVA